LFELGGRRRNLCTQDTRSQSEKGVKIAMYHGEIRFRFSLEPATNSEDRERRAKELGVGGDFLRFESRSLAFSKGKTNAWGRRQLAR
jgi:hypothetical protein